MAQNLTADKIRSLGFAWPKYETVVEYAVVKDGQIDIAATIEKVEASRAFYKGQLNQAFAFKSQHGADYSDFTNRHEEYSRKYHQLGQIVAYLNEILRAAEKGVQD
ncbi:MAG: hypothetical protein GY796_09705 [Chloroflexi bacterium]|nr:hypothetical protein [Chloroflexota bacterium]